MLVHHIKSVGTIATAGCLNDQGSVFATPNGISYDELAKYLTPDAIDITERTDCKDREWIAVGHIV
jgi:hypothetical protein